MIKKTKIVATISDKTCTPDFIKSLYKEGMKFYKAKNYDAAFAKFEQIREIDPDYEKASYYYHACDYIIKAKNKAKND